MKRCLILLLWLAGGVWLSAGINRWTTGGPYGGEILFITVDPQTPNVLYAGIEYGGFYKSLNWGQSWEAFTGLDYVTACTVHPVDHNLILACRGLTIFRSTDAGASWLAVNPGGGSLQDLAIPALRPDFAYAAGLNGFWRSTDRGQSWVQTAPLSGVQVDNISLLPGSPDTIFLGTWGSGILKSTNGGFTWNNIFPMEGGYGYRVACHPDRAGLIYASDYGSNGIYRSTDGGTSWTKILTNYFLEMAFDPINPDRLYFITLDSAYLSTNGGLSATRIHTLGGRSLTLDRATADGALYLGTLAGIQRSWDKGAKFQDASFGILTYAWNLAVSPTEPGTVYAGDDTGVFFRSQDSGDSWKMLGDLGGTEGFKGLTVTTATSPPTFFGAINGDLWKSTNEGSSWSLVLGDKYFWDLKTDPTDPNRIYASSGWMGYSHDFAGLFTSTDGGASWNETRQLDNVNITELLIDPTSPQTLYAGGDGGLYKSTNYGASWSSITAGLGDTKVRSLVMETSSPPTLFAGTSSAGVYCSTNGGASWSASGLSGKDIIALGGGPVRVGTGSSLYALYAGSYTGLYESHDYGSTWSAASPDLANARVQDITTDNRGDWRVYAATNTGVYARRYPLTPTVSVQARFAQAGIVNKSLSNQVLPASAMTLLLSKDTFPSASSTNPIILELKLPAGAKLGQTLATGELTDLAVQPSGRTVLPLAVSEYAPNAASTILTPTQTSSTTAVIPAQAVQLFRCVAGEDRILLRLTTGISTWTPSSTEDVLGVTIGSGAGVWPPTAGSNWGSSGQFRQENTQFFGDLRLYDFTAQQGKFPVTLRAFYQKTGLDTGTAFSQNPVNLFQLDLDRSDAYANNLLLGAVVTGSAVADLNQDGYEDLISIDGNLKRLYWSLGRADGSFAAPQYRALSGDAPVTVNAADINGDGQPEILVADAGGHLTVYSWAILSQKTAEPGKVLAPSRVMVLAGVASASLVLDVNGDGYKDFLYTDSAANTFNVLYGQAFTTHTSMASGLGPVALATGDVDGDGNLEIAVANRSGGSVTIYHYNGGLFTSAEYPAGGQPVALTLADFGRDGRADLALALADQKALAVWKANTDGTFTPSQAQWIYFKNPPSAIQAENFDGLNGPDVLVGFADFYKLALCTSDAGGTLSYAYNINTLGDLELDPVNHVTLTEDNVISVASGTSLGGVCTRAGVAALAEQPFNLVHFPRSANLSFSVVNLGTAPALLNLELYNDNGTLQSGATRSIASGNQFACYLTDPALFGAAAAVPTRWVRGFVTQADTYGFWLANDGSTLNYLDGLPLPDIRNARSRFVLPGGTDSFRQVLLVNPSQAQAQVTLQRLGDEIVKQTLSWLLPGRGRRVVDLAAEMPALAAGDYLLVSADRPIFGCELFGDSQKLAALDGLPVPEAPATLYCPHVASGNLGVNYQTWLTMINASGQGTQVNLRLYDDNGQLLHSAPSVSVPPRCKVYSDFVTLFGLSQAVTGYLVVEVTGPGAVTGSVTFGEAGAGRFLSSLPLSASGAADYLIGHIANGSLGGVAFFTGLAILNPHDTTHSVRVTAFDQSGKTIGVITDSIIHGGREVFLLDQKMPDLTSIFGGYLRIEDLTDPAGQLRVFALFGDQPLNFLSAVAAQPVRK